MDIGLIQRKEEIWLRCQRTSLAHDSTVYIRDESPQGRFCSPPIRFHFERTMKNIHPPLQMPEREVFRHHPHSRHSPRQLCLYGLQCPYRITMLPIQFTLGSEILTAEATNLPAEFRNQTAITHPTIATLQPGQPGLTTMRYERVSDLR